MTVNVVIGPPCAGKSTFVTESATPGALIIDFDKIAKALGSATGHQATGLVKTAAFKAREAAIIAALQNSGEESWIIHTNPTRLQLNQYEEAKASIHTVDPGIDECLARAERDNRPEGTTDTIRDWYKNNQPVKSIEQLLKELREG